jgi:plasmid maintenance system antidote protein VapI
MNDFENGFQHQMNKLDLKRKDVAEALGVTMPTLKSKLRNPEKLTLKDVRILEGLNFKINLTIEQ